MSHSYTSIIQNLQTLQFSSVVSGSLQTHELKHTRPSCPSPAPGVHPKSGVHCVGDDIQPTHPLSSPSSPAFNLSQHQGLFQWVNSLHQVAKVLELQLQHQSFQLIFRTDFLGLPEETSFSFPCGSPDTESTCIARDLCLIPGLGRSPGEEKGYPL